MHFRPRATTLAALGLALAATACGSAVPPPAAGPTPTPTAAAPAPVPFQSAAAGPVGAYDQPSPMLALARDEAAFRQLWAARIGQNDPAPALQKLDFTKHLAAVVFSGRRPTGGYGITVQKVERSGGQVVITAATREPAPGALLPQVITSPWEAVALDKAALPNWDRLHYILINTAGTTLAEADP